jgi:hypothetical protein
VRPFKGIIYDGISEFESYHLSQAIWSPALLTHGKASENAASGGEPDQACSRVSRLAVRATTHALFALSEHRPSSAFASKNFGHL